MPHQLSFERIVSASAHDLYEGWTNPKILVRWFTPDPWRTTEAEIDAVPGGIFRTVMEGPDGERNEGSGCVLEAIPGKRFTWTSALGPHFAPNEMGEGEFPFTATIELETVEQGTRYKVIAHHANENSMRQHAEMGFEQGWNAALDQLLEVIAGNR